MASDPGFVEFVCEQIRGAGRITHRRMFGEFAVYCDGKVVALVCDNQFFLKPTAAGKALLDRVKEAPPYPGARPYYLIDSQLEAAAAIVRATAEALPLPKARTTASGTRTSKSTTGSTGGSRPGAKPRR
jgi:TfoX/Sxy family transcriptional regulator of competence genes